MCKFVAEKCTKKGRKLKKKQKKRLKKPYTIVYVNFFLYLCNEFCAMCAKINSKEYIKTK